VAYTRGDTGGSLHAKVQEAERGLLRAYWPRIMAGEEFSCTPQAAGGSYHSKREFFDLKTHPPYAMMTEGDLVRLAQAVEFPGYNGLQIKSEGQLR